MNEQDRHDLQRWLDGALDEPELAAFERRVAADAELRAEVQLHERVGASLRRSFAVPDIAMPDIAAPNPPGQQPEGIARPRRWPVFVMGAASAAAVLLVWLQPWRSPERAVEDPARAAILRTAVGRSWLAVCELPPGIPQPVSCSVPGEVPLYVQPLVPDLPASLEWRDRPGVRFERGVEAQPQDGLRVLEISVAPQTRVFLFIVPAAADPRPALPQDVNWRLFRESRGPLVVYEVTPLDEPHGLPCLVERP